MSATVIQLGLFFCACMRWPCLKCVLKIALPRRRLEANAYMQ